MKFCGRCGCGLEGAEKFCPACGAKIVNMGYLQGGENVDRENETVKPTSDSAKPTQESVKPTPNKSNSGTVDSIIDKLNDYVGNDKPAELNWKVLFSDVFKPHTKEEAENIFICGTAQTTPHIKDVSKGWPHPWLYSRVFLMFAIAYALLWVCCSMFSNTNTLPGLIVVGSFAVPLVTMMLFMEVNAYRNISFYEVIKIFLVGGCASLVATLFLFSIIGSQELDYTGAFIVGMIEELGKALIVCYFVNKMQISTILGGMLIGASVGAGFAAFESAGYAMNPLLQFMQYAGYAAAYGQQVDGTEMLDLINNSIFTRGFLAPGGHVAWAAISGAALAMVARVKEYAGWSLMTEKGFLRLFIIPVILHAVWDCPFTATISGDLFIGYIALCLAVWIVLLVLINMGLSEVNKLKEE